MTPANCLIPIRVEIYDEQAECAIVARWSKLFVDLMTKEETTMHYRNGREAKNGDKVIQIDSFGQPGSIGVLYGATPGNDYCNGSVAQLPHNSIACLIDCLHVDDVAAMLKEKGLDKRPAGK